MEEPAGLVLARPDLEMTAHDSARPSLVRRAVAVIDRGSQIVEQLLLAISGAAIVATMLLITASALGRYAFSRPIAWSEVWVGLYLAPLITFLALASTLSHRQHVGVTILVQRSGRRIRRMSQIAGALLVSATFAVLAYQGGTRTWSVFESGQVEYNIGVPMWLAHVVVPVGCAAIAVRAALLAATWWLDGSWRISLSQPDNLDEATEDPSERGQALTSQVADRR